MFRKCLFLLLTTGTCFAANSGEYAAPDLITQTLGKLQADISSIPDVVQEDTSWCQELRDSSIARSAGKPKYESYLSFTSQLTAQELKDPLATKTHYNNFSPTTTIVYPVVNGEKTTAVLSYHTAGLPIRHRNPNGMWTLSGTLVQVYLKDKKYDFAQPESSRKTVICVVLAPV